MEVAICVITFRRPRGLSRLVDGLNQLTFRGEPPGIRLVVVDNDASAPARQVCDELGPKLNWPLEYHIEPRRAIPYARNKAVTVAMDRADFIAFVDDDETVEPNWLDELLHAQAKYDADVVAGPVLPRYEGTVPDWVIKGRYFYPARHQDGSVLEFAYTGNVLARAEVYRTMDSLFDERMALTGGSDTHFFKRVHVAGYKIVWSDHAIAHQFIPSTRVSVRWLLQRNFRFGNCIAIRRLDALPSLRTYASLAATGCYRIIQGFVLFPAGAVFGRHILMNSGRRFASGIGILFGVIGGRYEEYRRAHGE